MIFNSTVASGDTGNWQNDTRVEINQKADIADTLAGYGIEDAYTKSEINNLIPEIFRNISHRWLDEPRSVMWTLSNNIININWNDPNDITTEEPATAIYAGTVVVKKQDSPPKNKWDGIIVDEYSNKNKYSVSPLTDTITNGVYYYGIFPFDDDGIARHYRWTKTFKVDANEASPIAVINSTEVLGTTSIKVNYTLPSQNYSSIKMVYKTGGVPTSINDGVSFDLSGSSCTLSNLSVGTTYGFIIYVIDLNYRINASNSVTATTGDYIKQSVMSLLTDHSSWIYATPGTNWSEGGTITHNSDGTITVSTDETRNYPRDMHGKAAVTSNKVNISGWDRLCVEFKSISGPQVNYMGIFAAPNNVFGTSSDERVSQGALQNWQPNVKYSLSLTGLSASEMHIGVGGGNNVTNGSTTIVVKDLWLEKG